MQDSGREGGREGWEMGERWEEKGWEEEGGRWGGDVFA